LPPEELRRRKNDAARLRQAAKRADPVLGPAIKADDRKRLEAWKAAYPEEDRVARAAQKYRRRAVTGQRSDMPAVSKDGRLTWPQWEGILAAFNGKCAYCDAAGEMQIEHVVPVARGGTHTADNIVPSCKKCNNSKNAKELRSWLQDEDRYQFVCDMRSSI